MLFRSTDVAKVLDFGLVMASVDMGKPSDGLATAANTATGTPAFMPPEIGSGKGPVDERSDLYSLGCVAYWMLTGTLVFSEDNPMSLMIAHIQDEPVHPSERMDMNPPRDLEIMIMKLLAKDPADRPQNAMEVAEAMVPIEREAGWSRARSRDWWEKHIPADAEPPRPSPADSSLETLEIHPSRG